ncbi:MAG: hypothetical protein ACM32E_20455 [Gemmatimonadota bacterium]
MADLRRLGRRGSYRLGGRGVPGQARPARPHHPSFRPARRGRAAAWLAGGLAAAAVIAAGAALGWWWVPFPVGLAAGAAARYGPLPLRAVLPALALAAAAGWALPLAGAALAGLPERQVARTVAALAGLPAHASLIFAVTLLVAVLQALAGCWVAAVLTPRRER